jgi:hypothetical protein
VSSFSVTAGQRRRLLEGDYTPLDFDVKPFGCEPGAVYVLAWRRAEATLVDEAHGLVARTPRHPVWYLTVREVQRHRKGFWRVRFDVTDLRDTDLFLRPGGGVQAGRDVLDAGRVPDPEWLDSEAEAICEHWDKVRDDRHRERMGERSRARRQRAA